MATIVNTLQFLTKFPKKSTRLILSTWLEHIQAKGKVMGILSWIYPIQNMQTSSPDFRTKYPKKSAAWLN
jgi:hypothetical protein